MDNSNKNNPDIKIKEQLAPPVTESEAVIEVLSKETLNSLNELGEVLKNIRKRMVKEGYEIVDGVIRKK